MNSNGIVLQLEWYNIEFEYEKFIFISFPKDASLSLSLEREREVYELARPQNEKDDNEIESWYTDCP